MDTLTAIPSILQAGDSCQLLLSLPLYPASAGWAVTWVLAGASRVDIESAPEEDEHKLVLSASDSRSLLAGSYRWALFAKKDDVRKTVAEGIVVVRGDLASFAPGEGVSYARRMLSLCRTARENILRGELKSYMINGRQTMLHTLAEVAKEEAYWTAQCAIEEANGRRTEVVFTSNMDADEEWLPWR